MQIAKEGKKAKKPKTREPPKKLKKSKTPNTNENMGKPRTTKEKKLYSPLT